MIIYVFIKLIILMNELHSKFEIKRMEREWFHLSDNDIDNIINEYGFIRVRNSVKDKKI